MEQEEPVYRLFTDILSRFIIKNAVLAEQLPLETLNTSNDIEFTEANETVAEGIGL